TRPDRRVLVTTNFVETPHVVVERAQVLLRAVRTQIAFRRAGMRVRGHDQVRVGTTPRRRRPSDGFHSNIPLLLVLLVRVPVRAHLDPAGGHAASPGRGPGP